MGVIDKKILRNLDGRIGLTRQCSCYYGWGQGIGVGEGGSGGGMMSCVLIGGLAGMAISFQNTYVYGTSFSS